MSILISWLGPLRAICMAIDGVAFSLLDNAYQIVINLSTAELFQHETIRSITNNLYILIGVVAFFRLALVLVNAIIDPEKLNEKGKGLSNIFFRVVGMVILLAVTPFLFQLSYELQEKIVGGDPDKNIIFKTILGDNANMGGDNAGKALQNIALSSLITVNENYYESFTPLECVSNGDGSCTNQGGYVYGGECDWDNCYSAVSLYNDLYVNEDMSPTKLAKWAGVSKKIDGEEVYVYDYMMIVTTVVGIFMTYIIISFAIDIAVRMFELLVLEVLSPLFIATFVDPKSSQSGPFKNWLSAVGKSYANLYIKLAILALIILLISLVNQSKIFNSMGDLSGWTKIFVVIGLLIFAKKAPKWIMDMIGIKSDESGLGGLSIGKKLGGMALAGGLVNKARDGIKGGLKKQGDKILDHGKKRLGNMANKALGGYAVRKAVKDDAKKAFMNSLQLKDGEKMTLAQRRAANQKAREAAKSADTKAKVKATRAQIQGDFKANNDMRAFAGMRDKFTDYAKGAVPTYQSKREKELAKLGDKVTELRTAAGMGSDEIKKLEKEAADIRKGKAIYGDAFDVEKWRQDKSLYPLASDKINNSYAEYLGGNNPMSTDEIKIAKYLKDINVKLDASNLNNLLNGKSISVNIDGKMENLTKKQMIDTITETENSYQRAIWNQAAYDNVISNSTDYVQAKELMEDARKEYADLQYKFSSATTTEAQEQIQEAMQAVYSKLGQYKKDMKDLESARINAVLNSGNGTFDVEYETDGTIKSGILNLAEGKKVDDVDRTAVQFGNKWCTTSGVYEINKDGKWEFKTKDMTMYFDAIKKALEDKKAKQFDDAVQREENKFKEAEKNAKGSDNK